MHLFCKLFFCVLILTQTGFSQIWYWENSNFGFPRIHSPSKKQSLKEELQSQDHQKNTETFLLKGNVKSVIETITSNGKEVKAEYHFLKNKQLSIFQIGDTLKSLTRSLAKIEKYHYQADRLSQIEIYTGYPQNSSKAVHTFDQDGFLVKTVYECYECSQTQPPFVFDYEQDYVWNPERDSVWINYQYKTPPTSYERKQNKVISLAPNSKQLHKEIFNRTERSFRKEKTDSQGRITEVVNIDREIKSSMNIDSRFLYSYNSENEFTKIERFQIIHKGTGFRDWELVETFVFEYPKFDKEHNWTEKRIWRNAKEEILYTRVIQYYEP